MKGSLSYNMHLFLPYLLNDIFQTLPLHDVICGDFSDWSHFHFIMPVMPDKAEVCERSAALCTALPRKQLFYRFKSGT